jgi:proline-rich protein PRCC
MLGVEGYGSDSDSETETITVSTIPAPSSTPATKPASKPGLALPPPSASTSKASTGLALPAPKKKAPKKIAIGLPSLPSAHDNDEPDNRPPAKKPRLEAGAGASALLSMLPAPKNKNPVPQQQERVLGGGRGPGLVFNTGSRAGAGAKSAKVEDAEDEDEDGGANEAPRGNGILEDVEEAEQKVETKKTSALPFLPPSLAKGKANISTEEQFSLPRSAAAVPPAAPAADFFSLGKCLRVHVYSIQGS